MQYSKQHLSPFRTTLHLISILIYDISQKYQQKYLPVGTFEWKSKFSSINPIWNTLTTSDLVQMQLNSFLNQLYVFLIGLLDEISEFHSKVPTGRYFCCYLWPALYKYSNSEISRLERTWCCLESSTYVYFGMGIGISPQISHFQPKVPLLNKSFP